MQTISGLKEIGKRAFKSNYWMSVFVSFVMTAVLSIQERISSANSNTQTIEIQNLPAGAVATVTSMSLITLLILILIRIFIYNPYYVGAQAFFKENVLTGSASGDEVLRGFRNYINTFVTLLLRDLYVALFSFLLVVPGIMKAYSYRLVPYIITDEPELSSSEVLRRSEQMMRGHRMDAFMLDLSFFGWYLLVILTLGLAGIFWVFPYKNNTDAALYQDLRDLEY